MTKEENLKWLGVEIRTWESECRGKHPIKEALYAARKALEQEQDKPMVEIDLYSVIKQKYIEREVLDEIRAEIEEQVLESLSDGGDDWFTAEKVNECLEIIDKYKAESEEENGNDD